MFVIVLGSVQVLDEHRRDVLAGAGPRQRSLLAALALAGHHTLDTDQLIDWMWGDDLPADPRNALSLHASRLRARLQRAFAGRRLLHEGGRYRLDLDGGDVDIAAFRSARGRAGELLRSGEEDAALVASEAGLARWTGRPLSGIPETPSVRARVTALEEELLAAQGDRVELALAAGSAARVLGDLATLVGSHPLDERLRALQVRALHAAGRTADALQAYASARRALVDELGVGPGTQLQSAQRDVLRAPAAAASSRDSGPTGVSRPTGVPGPTGVSAPTPATVATPASTRTPVAVRPRAITRPRAATPITWSVRPATAGTAGTTALYRWTLAADGREYPEAG